MSTATPKVETGITRNQLIAEMARSAHGDLKQYIPILGGGTIADPEFIAHLMTWNAAKGQVRDPKIALPVITMAEPLFPGEYVENSAANLLLLDPRSLVRAVEFAKTLGPGVTDNANARRWQHHLGGGKSAVGMRTVLEKYLRAREASWPWFERSVLQHRRSIFALYRLARLKPSTMASDVLYKKHYPAGSALEAVQRLHLMTEDEVAAAVAQHRIPYLVVKGALANRERLGHAPSKDSAVLTEALVDSMSATEAVTNARDVVAKAGGKAKKSARAAFGRAVKRAAGSTKATLKATVAAEADEQDAELAEALRDLQEKQIKALGGVEGNWLVLGDRSGSMKHAIEKAREVAAVLTSMVRGRVHLVFFDLSPTPYEVTGKSFEQIRQITRGVVAGGATSVGCGLAWAREKGLDIDGIAMVGDGGENSVPDFVSEYQRYARATGKEPTVYFYHCPTPEADQPMQWPAYQRKHGIDVQTFDLRKKGSQSEFTVDYHSLPNLVQTMRTNRYSLADEILAMPLLTMEQALRPRRVHTS